MTRSTSEVAVCCSRLRQIVRTLAKFFKQTRVLDGDDRLCGKARYQLDLLLGERLRLLAVDDDSADQLVLLEHRHGN